MRTTRWMLVFAVFVLLGFVSAAVAKPPPSKPASRCGDGVVDSNTITDENTGLTWEKKEAADGVKDAANLHDVDNCYPWTGTCTGTSTRCGTDADCTSGTCDTADCQTAAPAGMTIFEWVASVNDANFTGHADWRVPNIRELTSIADYGSLTGVDPQFVPNSSGSHWSSTSYLEPFGGDFFAWASGFGFAGIIDKQQQLPVRAVRDGAQP